MDKIQKLSQIYPEAFEYLSLIHGELLSEQEKFLQSLKEIVESLRVRNINTQEIPKWLYLVNLEHRNNLETSWLLTNFMIDLFTSGISCQQVTTFDPVFDTLRLQRRKIIAFFRDSLPLIIKDCGITSSVILRKVKNHLELFDEEAEDNLFKIADNNPEIIAPVIVRLICGAIAEENIDNYSNTRLKKYKIFAKEARLSKKQTLAQLEKLDNYLEYFKKLQDKTVYYLDNYLKQKIAQQAKEFIIETQVDIIMNEIKDFDSLRVKLIEDFTELCNFLNERGRLDEKSDLEKELKKLQENTYQIAFIATMKAGKSTLINISVLSFSP